MVSEADVHERVELVVSVLFGFPQLFGGGVGVLGLDVLLVKFVEGRVGANGLHFVLGGCEWGGAAPCGGSGDCCSICSEDERCGAWTYMHTNSSCMLKARSGARAADSGNGGKYLPGYIAGKPPRGQMQCALRLRIDHQPVAQHATVRAPRSCGAAAIEAV